MRFLLSLAICLTTAGYGAAAGADLDELEQQAIAAAVAAAE